MVGGGSWAHPHVSACGQARAHVRVTQHTFVGRRWSCLGGCLSLSDDGMCHPVPPPSLRCTGVGTLAAVSPPAAAWCPRVLPASCSWRLGCTTAVLWSRTCRVSPAGWWRAWVRRGGPVPTCRRRCTPLWRCPGLWWRPCPSLRCRPRPSAQRWRRVGTGPGCPTTGVHCARGTPPARRGPSRVPAPARPACGSGVPAPSSSVPFPRDEPHPTSVANRATWWASSPCAPPGECARATAARGQRGTRGACGVVVTFAPRWWVSQAHFFGVKGNSLQRVLLASNTRAAASDPFPALLPDRALGRTTMKKQ